MRFVPTNPLYDSIDLAPYLIAGDNCIVVEAWSPNAISFQAMPEERGGFKAWGEIAGESLVTPGAWQMLPGAAWDVDSPTFSFAQGPVEILDNAHIDEAWFTDPAAGTWHEPVLIADPSIWGELSERDIPLVTMDCQQAQSVDLIAPMKAGKRRIGFRSKHDPSDRRAAKPHIAYAVNIFSEQAQTIEIDLFWGDNYFNGEKLDPDNHPLGGNRQVVNIDLQAGWNLLYGELQCLTTRWAAI